MADFLQPMLQYYPEKRVSAQELLKHPWLNMPKNFEYTMSEKEYQRMMIIKQNSKKEKADDDVKADVYESENELNLADDEDNDEYFSEEENENDFSDLSNEEETDDSNTIKIQNFNNSFAAYGQHVNLCVLDQPNPQFNSLLK